MAMASAGDRAPSAATGGSHHGPGHLGRVTVRRCRAEEVLPVRRLVLRPHQRLAETTFPGDSAPATAHFCAEDEGGRVVCVATVCQEEIAWPPGDARPEGTVGATPWRLRGMATIPEWRGKGAGSALLAAVVNHVAGMGGGVLWCNARLSAVAFYERAGMVRIGHPWDEPVIGPHVKMWKMVSGQKWRNP